MTDKRTGELLVGVSVVVKGTNRGSSTDASGKYRISGVEATTVLIFSFVGYQTQEITVSDQTEINVAMTSVVVVTAPKCTSLQVWADAFTRLSSSPARTLAQFKRAFPALDEVTNAFAKMAEVLPLAQGKQPEKLAEIMPPKLINVWLESLTNSIGSTDQVAFRPLALELFRILTGVIMFYSCVQKEDISKDPVPTEQVWGLITDKHIRNWQNAAPNFPQADRDVVKKMLEDAKAEFERTNRDDRAKQGYLSMLKRLIDILNSLPQ